MNHQPITTASTAVLKITCGACGKTQANKTMYADFARGIVHCGCGQHTS